MSNRIIVNFKAYRESTGHASEELTDKFVKVNKEIDQEVILAPTSLDIYRNSGKDIKIFGQHVDPHEPGSHTGDSIAENLKASGASGTLINHSEKRMDEEQIKKAVERCKGLGIETVVSARNVEEVSDYSSLNPDFIAFEPSELIGGDTAVSQAQPELIRKAVEETAEGVSTLTGAGIKSARDVNKCIEIGCSGVLVASGIVKSENPAESLKEMSRGL